MWFYEDELVRGRKISEQSLLQFQEKMNKADAIVIGAGG